MHTEPLTQHSTVKVDAEAQGAVLPGPLLTAQADRARPSSVNVCALMVIGAYVAFSRLNGAQGVSSKSQMPVGNV